MKEERRAEGPGGEVKGEQMRKIGGSRNRRSMKEDGRRLRWEASGGKDLSGNGKGKKEGGRSGLNAGKGRKREEEGRERQ